jgi:hypothetical protein
MIPKHDYIHSLWWLMHHSSDKKRKAIALAHYVDDSGTHDDSKLVVMGGPVFLQSRFFEFHYEWDRILARHGIVGPIHMCEFNQYRRFGHLGRDERSALFQDLVYLINQNKAYSLTVEVDNLNFQTFFPTEKYRGLIGPAPLAFFECMVLDAIIARDHNSSGKTAFVVAHSHNNIEMVDAHAFMVSYFEQKDEALRRVGSLTFDTPGNVNALQAADLVAWANRNKKLGEPFVSGFEPLERLTRTVEAETRPMLHFHYVVKPGSVEELSRVLDEPVRKKGKRSPLLTL